MTRTSELAEIASIKLLIAKVSILLNAAEKARSRSFQRRLRVGQARQPRRREYEKRFLRRSWERRNHQTISEAVQCPMR